MPWKARPSFTGITNAIRPRLLHEARAKIFSAQQRLNGQRYTSFTFFNGRLRTGLPVAA